MPSQSIAEAVQSGRSQGKQELAFAEAARQQQALAQKINLAAAFKVASGVIEGLTLLRDAPGSKFTFDATEAGDRACILTNIPVEGSEKESTLCVVAEADGHIAAYGDCGPHDVDGIGAGKTDPRASEKVITFVAKYATTRGLVP